MALIALVFAGVMNFVAYWFSDKLALRMAGAHEVTPQEEPELHAIVEEVAMLAGVPKPKVFVVENESPNAFATGRNPQHAVVAVTTGIMRILDRRELRAVIGHEMGHVKNRDILIELDRGDDRRRDQLHPDDADLGLAVRRRPRPQQRHDGRSWRRSWRRWRRASCRWRSRARASTRQTSSGAEYTHDPEALASALAKLHNGVQMRPMAQKAGAEATSSLYIVHPFRWRAGWARCSRPTRRSKSGSGACARWRATSSRRFEVRSTGGAGNCAPLMPMSKTGARSPSDWAPAARGARQRWSNR